MKFTCLQENLLKGLNIVSRAVPTSAPLPILSNVYLGTEKGRLKLAATNLSTTIITYIGSSIDEEGEITVPAKLFKDYVTNMTPETIEATLNGNMLSFKSKRTKTKFNGSSAEDFPDLPKFPKDSDILELDPQEFNDAISLVAFAASVDDSRPIFTGVYMSQSKDGLTIAASDGFRLSEKLLKHKNNVKDFIAVVPAKTVIEVAKIFSTADSPIQFSLSEKENQAMFKSEDTFVATRVLDGQYPQYKAIIPTESIVKAEFTKQDMLDAVKLTSIFAKTGDSDKGAIKIRIDSENIIKLTSLTESTGEHESEVPADIEGETMEIAINSKYLLDFLNTVKTEKIKFSSNGNLKPCLLVPEKYENFIHIIMPMQI